MFITILTLAAMGSLSLPWDCGLVAGRWVTKARNCTQSRCSRKSSKRCSFREWQSRNCVWHKRIRLRSQGAGTRGVAVVHPQWKNQHDHHHLHLVCLAIVWASLCAPQPVRSQRPHQVHLHGSLHSIDLVPHQDWRPGDHSTNQVVTVGK